MSLPYGITIKGFTPSWVYEHIRAEIVKLKNVFGIASLEGREEFFIGLEELDLRCFAALHLPTAVISIVDIAPGNSMLKGASKNIYEPGTITHEGEGTEDVELSGAHRGNNRYVLEITESGTIGTDGSYELRKTPWTGSDWGTEVVVSSGSIPASGKIEVGNGSIFEFTLNGNVVLGDTYSWETEAYKVSHVQGRAVTLNAKIEFYFFKPLEQIWKDYNPLDQMLLFFGSRFWRVPVLGGDSVDVEEELTGIRSFEKTFQVASGEEEAGVETYSAHAVELRLRYRGQDAGRDPCCFIVEIQPLMRPEITEVEIPEQGA